MMRLDDSREAGLLGPSMQYSSLETSMRMSEFDVPMSRRPKSRSRCYAMSACIVLIAVVAIVSVAGAGGKKKGQGDDTKSAEMREQHSNSGPAPAPEEPTRAGGGWASSSPAPPVGFTEPVTSPPSSPPSAGAPASTGAPPSVGTPLPAFAPSPYSAGYDHARLETICNETIDPAVCLDMFDSNPNSQKVDLQQWTIMSMEAAAQALNESYIMAVGMKDGNAGNVALQQCIDMFGEALDQVESSMYVVAEMDVHNPGAAGTDAAMSVTTAMTDQETCQEGIDDVGPFRGSDKITGDRAKHVNTMLSISLTFVNDLVATSVDPNHHRRLLYTETQFSPRLRRVFPGKTLP